MSIKLKRILYFVFGLSIMSCVAQKPTIKDIPEEDYFTPVYYSKNDFSFEYNGDLAYQLISYGTTNADSNEGNEIKNTYSETNNIFNFPLGKSDYSFALEPSLSFSSKYLIKATEDFSLFKISFGTSVDIDVSDLSNTTNKYNYTVDLPRMEYQDEKYQIPWSYKDEAFFAVQNDSLFKIFPHTQSKICLLDKSDIYNFSVSPSENSIMLFADDTLWHIDNKNKATNLVSSMSKRLGISMRHIRSFNWKDDESKIIFSEGWRIYVYDFLKHTLDEIEADAKIFSVEWINDDKLLLVTGYFPSDMSTFRNNEKYSIVKYSINDDKFTSIHERINHEPFSIKPRLSPSKKLILFSEKKLNGPYQVKLMTLDGKNENILAEGYLPFWGKVN